MTARRCRIRILMSVIIIFIIIIIRPQAFEPLGHIGYLIYT